MRNDYIVIEGLEGAGKTTACNLVFSTLKDLGIKKIILTREPGGTQFSEKLRNLILDYRSSSKEIIHNMTEMLMFYAARVQLVETIIKPSLESGIWVIGDRHDLSTQAYQGGGRSIDHKILSMIRDVVLGNFRPGLTLYLDITPEISLVRTRTRGKTNRIDQESLAFFNRTRARYLELASQDVSIHIIDAMQPLEIVNHAIRRTLIRWFQEQVI